MQDSFKSWTTPPRPQTEAASTYGEVDVVRTEAVLTAPTAGSPHHVHRLAVSVKNSYVGFPLRRPIVKGQSNVKLLHWERWASFFIFGNIGHVFILRWHTVVWHSQWCFQLELRFWPHSRRKNPWHTNSNPRSRQSHGWFSLLPELVSCTNLTNVENNNECNESWTITRVYKFNTGLKLYSILNVCVDFYIFYIKLTCCELSVMCMMYSLIGPQQILLQNSDSVNREKIVIISITNTCTWHMCGSWKFSWELGWRFYKLCHDHPSSSVIKDNGISY